MKTKNYYFALILITFMSWSCSTNNDMSTSSLKSSLNSNVVELANAMDVISASAGYKVLSSSNDASTTSPSLVKSSVVAYDSTYSSILLGDIKGVYNYKATPYQRGQNSLIRYFVKTAENDHMIVKLPESKVLKPSTLRFYHPADTLLKNNYIFDLSDYYYHFNKFLGWDYKMASTISIDSTKVGDLKIQSANSKTGYTFASEFVFAEKYTAKCEYATGDTAVTVYSINEGAKVLYEEKYTAIRTFLKTSKHKEREYALTIGDIKIVRKRGIADNSLDSAKVYVAGTLQLNSKVEFVTDSTSDDTENCIVNKKRDLKITFDDGTSATISELLGTSVNTIRTLFVTLRQASFATSVIDWIAWDIYTNK